MLTKYKLPHIKIDSSWILPSLICCGFVVLYILIIHFEYHNHLDDTWSVTQAYYYLKFGMELDYLVGGSALHLAHFAKTYAFIYGLWAEFFGWGRIAHQVLSVIFAWLGLWFWTKVFIKLGASRAMVISFAIVLLLSIAFSAVVTRTRGDALVFFLGALAIWFAVHRYWFWATLAALISVETHPMGVIYCIYVAGIWLITNELTKINAYRSTMLQIVPAALLGVGYYLILHYEHLDTVISAISSGDAKSFWDTSFMKAYFWDLGRYRHHMLELFLFVLSYMITLCFYRDRNSQLWKFLVLFPLLILLTDFIAPRGTYFYAIHSYPIFIMLSVYAWSKVKLPVYLFPLLISLYMLPQYGYWVYKNHDFYFPTYISKIHKHSEGIEADVIIGSYAHWFAFNHNKEHALKFLVEEHKDLLSRLDGNYILWVNDNNRNKFINALRGAWLNKLTEALSVCPKEELSSFDYAGHKVRFEGYDCRGKLLTTDNN